MADHRKNPLIENPKVFQRIIRQALVRKGWMIPVTEEEVRLAEEALSEKPGEIPEGLLDIDRLMSKLDDSRNRPQGARILPFRPAEDSAVHNQFARAAREGSAIPEDVSEKMKRDRRRAEREARASGADSDESS